MLTHSCNPAAVTVPASVTSDSTGLSSGLGDAGISAPNIELDGPEHQARSPPSTLVDCLNAVFDASRSAGEEDVVGSVDPASITLSDDPPMLDGELWGEIQMADLPAESTNTGMRRCLDLNLFRGSLACRV